MVGRASALIGQAVALVRPDWRNMCVAPACMFVTPLLERLCMSDGCLCTCFVRTLYEGHTRGHLSGPGDALAIQEYTQTYNSHSRLEFVGVGPTIII